jgi:hypothetical protein
LDQSNTNNTDFFKTHKAQQAPITSCVDTMPPIEIMGLCFFLGSQSSEKSPSVAPSATKSLGVLDSLRQFSAKPSTEAEETYRNFLPF